MVQEVYEVMRSDFKKVLDENYHTVTIVRPSETVASMGEITAVDTSTTSYTIRIKHQMASEKNLDHTTLGELNSGEAVIYTKHNYDSTDDEDIDDDDGFIPQLEDWYTDADGTEWVIEREVKGSRWKDNAIFLKFIVKRKV